MDRELEVKALAELAEAPRGLTLAELYTRVNPRLERKVERDELSFVLDRMRLADRVTASSHTGRARVWKRVDR